METTGDPDPGARLSQQLCNNCDSSPSSFWCLDCDGALCNDCEFAHRRVSLTRSHRLRNQPPPRPRVSPVQVCHLHTSEPLELYCFTCAQFTCKDCQLTSHRSHSFEFLRKATATVRKQLQGCAQPIRAQGDILRRSLQDMEARLEFINLNKGHLRDDLVSCFCNIMQGLKRRMSQIFQEILAVFRLESERLHSRMEELKQLLLSQQSATEAAERSRNIRDLQALLSIKTQMETQVKDFLDQDLSPPSTMCHMRVCTYKETMEKIQNFAHVEVSWIPFLVPTASNQMRDPAPAPPSDVTPPTSLFSSVRSLTELLTDRTGTSICAAAPAPVSRPQASNQLLLPSVSSPSALAFSHSSTSVSTSSFPPSHIPAKRSNSCRQRSPVVSLPCSSAPTAPLSSSHLVNVVSKSRKRPSDTCLTSPSNTRMPSIQALPPNPIMPRHPPRASPDTVSQTLASLLLVTNTLTPSSNQIQTFQLSSLPDTVQPLQTNLLQPPPDRNNLLQPPPVPNNLLQPPPDRNNLLQPPPDRNNLLQPPPAPNNLLQPPPDCNKLVQPPPDPNNLVQPPPDPNNLVQPPPDPNNLVQPPPVPKNVTPPTGSQPPDFVLTNAQTLYLPVVLLSPTVLYTSSGGQNQCDLVGGTTSLMDPTVHSVKGTVLPVGDTVSPVGGTILPMLCTISSVGGTNSLVGGTVLQGVDTVLPVEDTDPPMWSPISSVEDFNSLVEDAISPMWSPISSGEGIDSPLGGTELDLREPAETEPMSTVPENTEPPEDQPTTSTGGDVGLISSTSEEVQSGEDLSIRGRQQPSAVIGQQLFSLSHWKPRVSLLRPPVTLPRPAHPLPHLRLVLGDAEDEILPKKTNTLQSNAEDNMCDFTEPESTPGSVLSQENQSCSVCVSLDSLIVCTACARGYHPECHVPSIQGGATLGWTCSLCQDLSDPLDPYRSERTWCGQSPVLSLQDQRRCESLLLFLKVEGCIRLNEFSGWSHLDLILERLARHRPSAYQSAAQLICDVCAVFRDSSKDDGLKNLQQSFQVKLEDLFGPDLSSPILRALNQAGREAGSKSRPRSESRSKSKSWSRAVANLETFQ